jgi:hypothetical protein
MRLNLGCGYKKEAGWVNVDKAADCCPDLCFDLERPWPIETDAVVEVRAWHIFEHIGPTPDVYLDFIKELYRVCVDDARIDIHVPHHLHVDFAADPTHVRPITQQGLWLFSQAANAIAVERGWASTPLGRYIGVDFEVRDITNVLDPAWTGKGISPEQLASAASSLNNVVKEVHIEWRAIKPPGRTIGIFQPPTM